MFSQNDEFWVANVPAATVTSAQAIVLQGLGGVTATAAEINAGVDGLTATAVEITNKFDGSSSYKVLASTAIAAAYSILAADSGKKIFMPDCTANCTLTLPAPVAGLNYKVIYMGGAEDAEDWVIKTTATGNAFIGGLEHQDLDGNTIETVYSNGSGHYILTLDKPGAGTIVELLCNGTKWYMWGRSVSATVPAFS